MQPQERVLRLSIETNWNGFRNVLVASFKSCWSNSKGFNHENSEAIVRSGFKLIRELIMFDPTKRKSVIEVRDNFLMEPGAQPFF